MQEKSDSLYYSVGNCGDLRRKSDEKEITRIFNDFCACAFDDKSSGAGGRGCRGYGHGKRRWDRNSYGDGNL